MSQFAATLQVFFTDRLIRQRQASPHTIASYRDTMRLLLAFAYQWSGTPPYKLELLDLDSVLIARFLDYLESERGNSVRTRNARLAAIHSLFRFASLRHPEHADLIARVLDIPTKRGVVAPLWLRAKSAYGGGRGMFEHEVSQALPVQAREAEEVPRSQLGGIQRRAAPPGRFDSLV